MEGRRLICEWRGSLHDDTGYSVSAQAFLLTGDRMNALVADPAAYGVPSPTHAGHHAACQTFPPGLMLV